jgi:hypothetical protein
MDRTSKTIEVALFINEEGAMDDPIISHTIDVDIYEETIRGNYMTPPEDHREEHYDMKKVDAIVKQITDDLKSLIIEKIKALETDN